MQMTLTRAELKDYVLGQCAHFFPDDRRIKDSNGFNVAFSDALDRVEECFCHITSKGYSDNGQASFSHLHSDQYAQFLYFLANSLWILSENQELCDKLLCLNRFLSGMFVSYKCSLPEHFLFIHPVGTIIGNADYNDCLVILQNVTINTGDEKWQEDGHELLPKLGKGLFCASGTKVIGTKPIGDRVSLSAGSTVYNFEVPSDSIVTVRNGKSEIFPRKKARCHAQEFFDFEI